MAVSTTAGTPKGRPRKAPSRAFRLQPGEPVGKGIARIAHGRIGHALDELAGNTESTPEEAVHEARKDMKKLRGLLRMVRPGTSDRTYRRENAALRDVGRSLSGVRDADVMLATLADLEERFPGQLPADVAGGLRQALEAHRRSLSMNGVETAEEALGRIRDRVRTWTPRGDDFGVVLEGVERAYRGGRRALRAAREDPSAENLHEWRKRAKDHWYHLAVLREVWPPIMEPLADQAHALSDRLGQDHDLVLLLDFARERAPELAGSDGAAALARLIGPRQDELRREAFVLGERLYAEKPRAFSRRVDGLWTAWRADAPA